ncbi:MAG: TetR/AcrR family transcriptional regulator, partial [Deltaproteobacteria bacterium]|nr:TetR/AcrR family transcriptional regulator [Deltaproteobacteria bacterium]
MRHGTATSVTSKSRSGSGTPDTRERILEAALQAFAEKGFDGASTREIAGRAGVPLGLIQYHFGSKQKLWQAAVDRAFGEINRGLDGSMPQALDEESEVARMRAGIRAHVHYTALHPEFSRLMHDEGKRRGPRMRWIVDRHVKPMFARMERMILRLQELGRIPADIEPLHFVYALIGAIDTVFHQAEECRRVTGAYPRDPAFVEAHA